MNVDMLLKEQDIQIGRPIVKYKQLDIYIYIYIETVLVVTNSHGEFVAKQV